MAEHQVEARILLRYDTYPHWMNSTVILKRGEAAIAVFSESRSIENSDTTPENTPPAIGIKIGDGYHHFSELPWIQSVAADVYSWAKTATKPSYAASEIQGLQQYIEQYSSGGGGSGTVASRLYRIIQGTNEDANKYFLQYKENTAESDWVTDTSNYIDLSNLAKVLNWIGSDIDEYYNLGTRTGMQTLTLIGRLNYEDVIQDSLFVTAVNENAGIISVSKARINFSNITGTATINQGGTGNTYFPFNEVVIGNGEGQLLTRPIAEEIANNNYLVPNYLVKNYVETATAGLTGAMHFIGEATVIINNGSAIDPQISNYDFRQVQSGDVILGSNKEEFVWTGSFWRLLGDEGSYAIKGSITDADIASNADINISKIYNLSNLLDTKVDKIEGRMLTSNDFTDEEKQKLEAIEPNAQVNKIEHIFINDIEIKPTTIDGTYQNSISFRMSSLTEEEADQLRLTYEKVQTIEENAQVNKIESISVDNMEIEPDENKNINLSLKQYTNIIEAITLNNGAPLPIKDKTVNLTIDENAITFTIINGATVPGDSQIPGDTDVAISNKKLQLARIAKTGRIYDIQNTTPADAEDYLILNCGDSTTLLG